MSKEMNKLKKVITKYSCTLGLFMSLIIGMIFDSTIALIYLIGVFVAAGNFILNVYCITKWSKDSVFLVITLSFARIFLAVGCIIPFIYNLKLVISYLLGFISYFAVLAYCVIKEKGSA